MPRTDHPYMTMRLLDFKGDVKYAPNVEEKRSP